MSGESNWAHYSQKHDWERIYQAETQGSAGQWEHSESGLVNPKFIYSTDYVEWLEDQLNRKTNQLNKKLGLIK